MKLLVIAPSSEVDPGSLGTLKLESASVLISVAVLNILKKTCIVSDPSELRSLLRGLERLR